MLGLLRLLGNPHERLPVVHVAGSKGKGSVSAMLATILQRAGHRTGLFTSPHLVRFEERIQVNGRPIDPQNLADLIAEIWPAVEERDATPDGKPTFFEVATAIGFVHFARTCDIAVLEVGLGGRFDSTTVCRPLVTAITSISLDHTQQLGNTVASIAREKAGIIKRGVPAVSGAVDPEARAVIEAVCRERAAPLEQLGADFRYEHIPGHVAHDFIMWPTVCVHTRERTWPWTLLRLLGEHQAANAAVVVACVEKLRERGWAIPDEAVVEGLAQVQWPARMEVVSFRPMVVLDCAHNVASAHAVVETLRESFPQPPERRLLVFAASTDKNVPGILRELAPHFRKGFLTRYANNPRGMPVEQLADLWRRVTDRPFAIHPATADAITAARAEASEEDLVCVTGSVFLAGEVRPALVG
jgi:dihydrofolate synthase/folylpolyglutamate synthase